MRGGRGVLFATLLILARPEARCEGGPLSPVAPPRDAAAHGRALFRMNCAHCHGADATGDEGPDLHGLVKSDTRLAAIITQGIKGEMPRFSAKFSDAEVQALIAFLHSLK
jgi:mono/diheme cytochrome c family protein